MAKIEESRINHGKIDLTLLLKPIIELIQTDANHLLREQKGKIYVVTDDIIQHILNHKALVAKTRQEGQLFSNTQFATAIATLDKNPKTANEQKKQITLLEDTIYDVLQSRLAGKEAAFFGQTAEAYFRALTKLANRKMEIGIPQRDVFPDAHLEKEYPGTKALLRVPRHTIQITGDFSKSFVQTVKKVMEKRLSKAEYPDDEIEQLIEKVEQGVNDKVGWLSDAITVFEENAYGKIRRTYACSVLEKMATKLDANSPAIPYIRRVSDFNELVQGTLPNSGLSTNDLVVEFPNVNGKGVMSFDLMTEFSQAHTLNTLPFWFSFSELLSEVATTDSVTTSLGQHFKMNGNVPSEGFGSVFEFNVNKLTTMASEIKTAQGQKFPSEFAIRKVLRVAILYYVVFSNYFNQLGNVVDNYNEFRDKLAKLVAKKVNLNIILAKIATGLNNITTLTNNRAIRADFKKLVQSRKLDDVPPKEKIYLTISGEILNNTAGMEDGEPIVPLSSQQYNTVYLKYLKVTRHYDGDSHALIKEPIHITESLRYLITPPQASSPQKREMVRDINRNVLGVLFTPKDNKMGYFILPFENLTKLVIYYDRQQISSTQDDYLTGLARLIYVLLVYGVFKAVERLERQYQQSIGATTDDNLKPAKRTMLLMLSLYSTQLLTDETREHKHFTHDAHKAIEHLIKQYLPTKSQGFQLRQSKMWDDWVIRGGSQANKGAADKHIQQELNKDYRAANIIEGLSSGLDALWRLPAKPSLEKIALMIVTSRACDKTRQSTTGVRKVMYGEIHRFEYETNENPQRGVAHFYRHQPVQAFCDDMDTADSFKKPAVLFNTIRQLHQEGFDDVIIVTKVPFTRRIRMTIEEESSYTKPEILHALNQEMPKVRIYPLFTQKSYGMRLRPKKPKQPMFLPHDPNYDEPLPDGDDKSTLFRAASVLTNRVVGKEDDRTHSGITDYLFRWYPETVSIQSEAMATLRHPQTQACLHEILRFLHASAYEQFLKTQGNEKPLEAKLDALDTIIGDGDENLGHQANSLQFPKPNKSGLYDKTHYFSINMIALLKHLENQSVEHRKKNANR